VVRRDLFDDAQCRFLSDHALLERLAIDKLELLADAEQDNGWAWVEARLSVDSQALRQFAPCAHGTREPLVAEQKDLDALARRSGELALQGWRWETRPSGRRTRPR